MRGIKYWTKNKIKVWCWKFIVDNGRLPTNTDFSDKNHSATAPNLLTVLQNFTLLDNLINECRPNNRQSLTWLGLKEAFKRFYSENGRYPTAMEVDKCPYLPSSRTIQRSWGGLVNLRKILKLDVINYGIGKNRSDMASQIWKRGINLETKIENILVIKFGEIFVHTQRRIGNVNIDFLVYTKTVKFGVDVFEYVDRHSLVGIINHKQKIYKSYPYTVILLPGNENIKQEELDSIIKNKKNPLPTKCRLINFTQFTNWINTLIPLPDPYLNNNNNTVITEQNLVYNNLQEIGKTVYKKF